MGTRSFPGVKSGRGVTLTPYPLLVPWSWKCRAIPLLPLWAVRPVQSLSACTRVHFLLSPQKCAYTADWERNVSAHSKSDFPLTRVNTVFLFFWPTGAEISFNFLQCIEMWFFTYCCQFLSLQRAFWYTHSSFTNRCTFIKTLITIYIKIRWLLHVSVYDHHQGAYNWAWLKLYWY